MAGFPQLDFLSRTSGWALSSDDSSNEGTALTLAQDAKDLLALNVKLLPSQAALTASTPPYPLAGGVNAGSFMSQDGTQPLSPFSQLEAFICTPSFSARNSQQNHPFAQPGSSKALQSHPLHDFGLHDFNPLSAAPAFTKTQAQSNGLILGLHLPSPTAQPEADTAGVLLAGPPSLLPGSAGKLQANQPSQPPASSQPPATTQLPDAIKMERAAFASTWPGPVAPFNIVKSLSVRESLQGVNAAIQKRESALAELPVNNLKATAAAGAPAAKPKQAAANKKRQRKH